MEPRITFDLEGCTEWSLQSAHSDRLRFIRCMDDAEAESIRSAASFCRRYVIMPFYRLLYSSHRVWQQTVARLSEFNKDEMVPASVDDLLGALVGWLLVWRLIIDQTAHDVSSRFGKESNEFRTLKQAKSDAYDSHQGYRLAEAIRNMVQHQELPPFNLSKSEGADPGTGDVISEVSLILPVSWLLDSPKCPARIKAEFESDPDYGLDLIDVIEDAMAGMGSVLRVQTRAIPRSLTGATWLR